MKNQIIIISGFLIASCGVVKSSNSAVNNRGGGNASPPAQGSPVPSDTTSSKALTPGGTTPGIPSGAYLAYDTDILPIMKVHCTDCHTTASGAKPSGGYDLLVFDPRTKWQVQVKHALETGIMPPAGTNYAHLTDAEMQIYENWVKAGAPKDQTEARQFAALAVKPGLVAFDCKTNPPWGVQRDTVFQTNDMLQASIYKMLKGTRAATIPTAIVDVNGTPLNILNYGGFSPIFPSLSLIPQDHTLKHFDAERPFNVGYTLGLVSAAQSTADFMRNYFNARMDSYQFLVTNFVTAGDPVCATNDPFTISDACFQKIITGIGYQAWRGEAADKLATLGKKFTSLRAGGSQQSEAFEVIFASILSDVNFASLPDTHGVFQGAVGGFTGSSKDLATKMAFFMTGVIPDVTLLKAAEATDLTTNNTALRAQFDRLTSTPEFSDRMYKIFSQMFNYDQITVPQLDMLRSGAYPYAKNDFRDSKGNGVASLTAFTASAQEEMRQFTLYLVNQDRPLTDFLTSRIGYVNDPNIAQIYGVPTSNVPVELPPDRMGFATRVGFLMDGTQRTLDQADMIHKRGYPLAVVLGNQSFDPPPAGVALSTGNSTLPVLTPRDVVSASTNRMPCAICHENKGINPFGYTLDVYDAIGRRRTSWPVSTLVGKTATPTVPLPVNTSATLNLPDMGISGTYPDWPSLATALAANDHVKQYLTRRVYTSLFGQVSALTPLCNIDTIGLDADKISIKELLWRIINTPEFNRFMVQR